MFGKNEFCTKAHRPVLVRHLLFLYEGNGQKSWSPPGNRLTRLVHDYVSYIKNDEKQSNENHKMEKRKDNNSTVARIL